MTLINKILRIIPKKHIDIEELDRKSMQANVVPVQTIRRDDLKVDIHSVHPMNERENTPEKEEYEILEREIMPEKIICPDCGGMTLEGLEYCDKCGGDLTNY